MKYLCVPNNNHFVPNAKVEDSPFLMASLGSESRLQDFSTAGGSGHRKHWTHRLVHLGLNSLDSLFIFEDGLDQQLGLNVIVGVSPSQPPEAVEVAVLKQGAGSEQVALDGVDQFGHILLMGPVL
jgi:hypothetical protein